MKTAQTYDWESSSTFRCDGCRRLRTVAELERVCPKCGTFDWCVERLKWRNVTYWVRIGWIWLPYWFSVDKAQQEGKQR